MNRIFIDKDWGVEAVVQSIEVYKDVFYSGKETEIMFRTEKELYEFVLLNVGMDCYNDANTFYIFDMAVSSMFLASLKQKSNVSFFSSFQDTHYKFISDYGYRNYSCSSLIDRRVSDYGNACFILSDSIHYKHRKGYGNGRFDNVPITMGHGKKNYDLISSVNKIHLTTVNKNSCNSQT
jgi:hypothetical protein